MPAQHQHRPLHLALAIAFALGCADFAMAQQITADTSPAPTETPEDLIAGLDAFIHAADTTHTKVTKAYIEKHGVELLFGDTNDLVTVLARGGLTGVVDGGDGDDVLQLDAANGGSLGETRNFEGLEVKRGAWTRDGASDFSIGVLVRPKAILTNSGHIDGGVLTQGTLNNNGEIRGAVTVLSDGTLNNAGTIEGGVDVRNRGAFSGQGTVGELKLAGTLSVNRLQGAPTVVDDLNMSNTAELVYEVNANGRSETINVGGTARLNDATLSIVAVPGEYPVSSQHTLIDANKVEGQFGNVVNGLAFMNPTLQYHEKSVALTYARNDVSLDSVATSESGRQLAQSIDEPEAIAPVQMPSDTSSAATVTPNTSPATNTAVTALLGANKATASRAIEQLAGGSNANLANATLSSVSPVTGSMLSAMRQLGAAVLHEQSNTPRLAAGSNTRDRVWLQALGNGGTVDRRHESSTLQHATKGLVLGTDWALGEQWRLGVIGAKSQTRLDGSQLDGELNSWHLGAYALHQRGPLALRLGATHSSHEGSSKRRVAFNGFSDRPTGSYDASTQQAFAEVGYTLRSGNVSAEPFVTLGYQRYQRDSYTENGGAATLRVHGQTQNNLNSTFGLRLAQLNTLDNGMQLTPRLSAGWKHTYGNINSKTRQRLATGGKNFTVEGAALDRDGLMLGAGLDLAVSARHTLGVGYNGEIGSDSRSHGVTGQWQMVF
ncbi:MULTISPECIES: autotransporter domain-containing protein [unclassified Pseudomonas]|uniref:autotransporter family protein n=1 Tax=unclassified Pseudomonas TaxID=196821 RepID=UPI002AC8D0FB|nr:MULTISPECIES: autotransporter domain-containing protein [unclassified Pseudomonas]MEB0047126.1 autotransporter domain-containing protein [Pseudomonas sp. Dout3]MEB0098525.1 autotransporter domain-containing protein [Pseudomonas sp. DC1.2]WPX58880.1 autotransporter domain-containing protein [Pseudomonas sp. DC1.2]